jgi:hypothetical protein
MEQNREAVLTETRRRWQARDSTPILPKFDDHNSRRKKKIKKERA